MRKAFIVAAAVAVLAALVWAADEGLFDRKFGGPTGAMVLSGADLPAGWWLAERANTSTEAEGLIEGSVTLSKKLEGQGDISTVFSWAWLFNDTATAKAFYERIRGEAATGDHAEFDTGSLRDCEGLVKPLAIGGNRAFVICRTGNLVWEVESRSTIGAAHLYAPTFANLMAKKVSRAG